MNCHFGKILGAVANIKVLNDIQFRDGFLHYGAIQFYGTNAHFHCDSAAVPDKCSYIIRHLNTPDGFSDITYLEFAGAAAQTYSFDDGAGAPGFLVNNPIGVTTVSTGALRIAGLNINNGSFLSPPGVLSIGKGINYTYHSAADGFTVGALGTFAHNSGLVSITFMMVIVKFVSQRR